MTVMESLSNIHPGEVLLEQFLKPMKVSAYRLSKDIGVPQTRTYPGNATYRRTVSHNYIAMYAKHSLTVILLIILSQVTLRQKQVNKIPTDKNPYEEYRNMAFKVTPIDLELNLPLVNTTVYGVIIDWPIQTNVATIVVFLTGDASVYLKSGQIYIGGFAYPTLQNLAKEMISSAQKLLSETRRTENFALPDSSFIQFSFLTNNGIFVHQETEESIDKNQTEWTPLFFKGNQIITEYRLITQNK